MNSILIKDKLKEGVDVVSRITGEHPTLTVLKNILIEARKDKIQLTGTNLEIGIQYTIPGKVSQEGAITVPAAVFNQLLGTLSEDRVVLSVKDATLEVTTDSYTAKIQGISAEEFPLIPKIESEEEYIAIEADVLRDAISSVLAASQFSELRPELNAIYFHFGMDKIVLAATDSFRLTEKTIMDNEFTSALDEEYTVLIPLKTSQELVRILKKGEVRIIRDDHQVLFITQEARIISRLVDGAFPDYHAIIPKDFQAELTLDREEFINAVKLTGVFGSAVPEISLRAAANEKGVELSARDEKLGENHYILPAKMKGDLQEVNFNWRYLLDGLKSLDAKEIIFGVNEENKPAILRAQSDPTFFYIVMPILKG